MVLMEKVIRQFQHVNFSNFDGEMGFWNFDKKHEFCQFRWENMICGFRRKI